MHSLVIAIPSFSLCLPQDSGFFLLKIKEKHMIQLLMCLFGFDGATEIDYTVDDKEIKVYQD